MPSAQQARQIHPSLRERRTAIRQHCIRAAGLQVLKQRRQNRFEMCAAIDIGLVFIEAFKFVGGKQIAVQPATHGETDQ